MGAHARCGRRSKAQAPSPGHSPRSCAQSVRTRGRSICSFESEGIPAPGIGDLDERSWFPRRRQPMSTRAFPVYLMAFETRFCSTPAQELAIRCRTASEARHDFQIEARARVPAGVDSSAQGLAIIQSMRKTLISKGRLRRHRGSEISRSALSIVPRPPSSDASILWRLASCSAWPADRIDETGCKRAARH